MAGSDTPAAPCSVPPELASMFAMQGGVATSPQILTHLSRRTVQRQLRDGDLVKIWPDIYSLGEPDTRRRLHGLDLLCGETAVVCLGTAAGVHGFDTEGVRDLHVLHPERRRLRDFDGLVVHRRDGAPLTTVNERPVTAPSWTAIEVARGLHRPRALATLDAALRSGDVHHHGADGGGQGAGRAGRNRRRARTDPAGPPAGRVTDGK